MPTPETIRTFWDAKAEEDPFWFVSTCGAYGHPRNLDDFWESGRKIWQDIKREIGYVPAKSDCVVEIGCGVGRVTRAIAPEVGTVHSFDISEKMLCRARGLELPNVCFHLARGFDLHPLADQLADLVLAYCVFQHLPSNTALASYLREMARVAKPGAFIAFTLTPRTWHTLLIPLLRSRAWLRERILRNGPRGLHRKEWVGIRPRVNDVLGLAPVPLVLRTLHGDKWLFFGRTGAETYGQTISNEL